MEIDADNINLTTVAILFKFNVTFLTLNILVPVGIKYVRIVI